MAWAKDERENQWTIIPSNYVDMDLLDDTNGYNIQALQRENVQNPAFPSGSHARFQLDAALCKQEGICKKCYRQSRHVSAIGSEDEDGVQCQWYS